jgi:hypothetical protein
MNRFMVVIASMLLTGCVAGTTETATPSQRASTALPTPAAPAGSQPTYSLECGELPRSTCEESGTRLVERWNRKYPNLHVVSLTFIGPCGSFQMRFNDGSGAGGDIDCIPPAPPN